MFSRGILQEIWSCDQAWDYNRHTTSVVTDSPGYSIISKIVLLIRHPQIDKYVYISIMKMCTADMSNLTVID